MFCCKAIQITVWHKS